ncbi:MAG TPA: ABC transporter substrate-binding protein [Chloroflexota bacterium]|jgi:ABC-type nitrate/sulfonate/bicarbonate transport system substrate-binding protein
MRRFALLAVALLLAACRGAAPPPPAQPGAAAASANASAPAGAGSAAANSSAQSGAAAANPSAPASAGSAGADPAASANSAAAAAPPSAHAGASSSSARPAPLSPPVTLQVWDGSSTIQAPLYIAQDRGYLQEQGIEIQGAPITGAFDAQVPLLATGQLDVGGGSIVPALFNAVGRGLPLRVTAIGALHTPGRSQLIVVRKNLAESGELRSYADLGWPPALARRTRMNGSARWTP